ncbi:Rpn family recombination-promoting nuclease/putative transposase [uncultured Selenomonas sp.]|uniref:Rpn family recombination-promoting nuclease/putative transposase n=1 Tax=uncultured Selenomonas sp. TaxID=159275 RepID=UPI0025F6512C|nr:Rpn family recombination-promoting nuclease/putative transposase [uncultured Selenomonas sp.]
MQEKDLETRIFDDLDAHRANPMNDVLFKFIFGKIERKNITIDFLNAVLEESLEHPIRDIRFTQTEQVPQDDGGKLTRFDVACELDSGEMIDVEVQVINYQNMQRRTLYYWSQMYLTGILSGEDYAELRPAITINILAFNILPQADPHAMYSIYNTKTGDRLNKDMELHFLEIPKFTHKPVHEMTKMERWLAYFGGKLSEQEKEELAMSEAAIGNAYDATSAFMMNPQDRMNYVNRQMAIMDYNSGMNAAEKRGEARMATLIQRLIADGRTEDVRKVSSNAEYRKKLYKEMGV